MHPFSGPSPQPDSSNLLLSVSTWMSNQPLDAQRPRQPCTTAPHLPRQPCTTAPPLPDSPGPRPRPLPNSPVPRPRPSQTAPGHGPAPSPPLVDVSPGSSHIQTREVTARSASTPDPGSQVLVLWTPAPTCSGPGPCSASSVNSAGQLCCV